MTISSTLVLPLSETWMGLWSAPIRLAAPGEQRKAQSKWDKEAWSSSPFLEESAGSLTCHGNEGWRVLLKWGNRRCSKWMGGGGNVFEVRVRSGTLWSHKKDTPFWLIWLYYFPSVAWFQLLLSSFCLCCFLMLISDVLSLSLITSFS